MSLVELRAEGITITSDRMLAQSWLEELRLSASDQAEWLAVLADG